MPHTFNILPSRGIVGHMLSRVAVLALPEVAVFELGVLCEIFGYDREGLPEVRLRPLQPGRPAGAHRKPASASRPSTTSTSSTRPTWSPVAAVRERHASRPQEALDALRRAADRGAWVMSVCTGAFAARRSRPARRPALHHALAAHRRAGRRYPKAKVDPNVLYVADDNILTSAGTAAGIDAVPAPGARGARLGGRHRARPAHGRAAAPRRRPGPVHRDADARPPSRRRPCSRCSREVLASLDQPHTVETLAARAHMAPRTFARRFRAETGVTPHDWLTNQRVLLARRLLEETDLGIDAIAARAGFGSAATLRHHFTQRMGTTPQAYRATFKVRRSGVVPAGVTSDGSVTQRRRRRRAVRVPAT